MGLIFEQDERDLWWLDFCKSLGYLFTRGAVSLCLTNQRFDDDEDGGVVIHQIQFRVSIPVRISGFNVK